jgi:glucoamylase
MNYGIATADAWSQRLEAQGFASPSWLSPSGSSLGSPQFVVDDTSGTATLIVPQATFGTVVPGWVFTVALTGQDGTQSGPPLRQFTPTPGAYTFGVCPTSTDTNPICALDPNSVPKVMDTITPGGVSQGTELNPTLNPSGVELQGVTVP